MTLLDGFRIAETPQRRRMVFARLVFSRRPKSERISETLIHFHPRKIYDLFSCTA